MVKLRSPQNLFATWGLLWSHSVVEITPKVTLRKKLWVKYTLPANQHKQMRPPFRNVSSASKAIMKHVLYFIHTNDWIFGSNAVSVFQNFGEKWSYYYWRFPRRILLSKVSAKYYTFRNHLNMNKTGGNAIRLKLTNLQIALKKLADKHHRKVRIIWNQLFFGNE